ncbi:MAG TPA: lytic transglycosylase domain-containing protein [Bacilli bacterium]
MKQVVLLLRKKRVILPLVLVFIGLLFFDTDLVGKLLYPVKYEQDILLSSAHYNVDPYLVAAIIRVETNFATNKTSKKGAIGLMQLMPDTADWIIEQGQFSDLTKQRLQRPDVNIEVGTWYLDSLGKQFAAQFATSDPEKVKVDKIALISAAYNAGPRRVGDWLEQNAWDGSADTIGQIPIGETRHYIQRILYYYKKYKQYYDWEQ